VEPYYRRDLALVHHLGYRQHAAMCAPGVLALLEPVRAAGGLVVELGCGSGLLTKYLVDAGHRVIATDASLPMLDLARAHAPQAEAVRVLTLPNDPIPPADAIVSIGHAMSYLPSAAAVEAAIVAAGAAVRPRGVLAFDICDLEWGAERIDAANHARVGADWAIITRYETPRPDLFVRHLTTFVRADDGGWRRDDERHDNVLIDVDHIPDLLRPLGLDVEIRDAFGGEQLPRGLRVVLARRPA
jgi:SAM-dependent methyltransferase